MLSSGSVFDYTKYFFGIGLMKCRIEGAGPEFVSNSGVGSMLHQRTEQVSVVRPALNRPIERRCPVIVTQVRVGAIRKEEIGHLRLTVVNGRYQWRPAEHGSAPAINVCAPLQGLDDLAR